MQTHSLNIENKKAEKTIGVVPDALLFIIQRTRVPRVLWYI